MKTVLYLVEVVLRVWMMCSFNSDIVQKFGGKKKYIYIFISRLQATEMRFLRSIENFTKRDRGRNIDIRDKLKIESSSSSTDCSAQGQVHHCKRRNRGCSSAKGRASTTNSETNAAVLPGIE